MPNSCCKAMARKTEMHKKIAAEARGTSVSPSFKNGVLEAVMKKHGLTQEQADQAIIDFGG